VYGPIPLGTTLDHVSKVTLCQRPDHLELVGDEACEHAAGGTSANDTPP